MMRSSAGRLETRGFTTGEAPARHGPATVVAPAADLRMCSRHGRAPLSGAARVAGGELAHLERAGRRALLRSVRLPVDHDPARAADAFAAVVLELDRLLAVDGQAVVDDVEHLEERHLRTDVRDVV